MKFLSIIVLSFVVVGLAGCLAFREAKNLLASFEAEIACMEIKGEFIKIDGEYVCIAEPFREPEVVNRP